jgi:hypothetical protein
MVPLNMFMQINPGEISNLRKKKVEKSSNPGEISNLRKKKVRVPLI